MNEIVELNYCVYVLFSELDQLIYVGYTKDIKRRLNEHLEGRVISTKYRRPLKLIFIEYYLLKEDAKYREIYFKTSKGKRMLKLMLSNTLKDLAYNSTNA
jgi:putative endonuclease